MAENQTVNKVIYDGRTLIDLTSDTVEASDVINAKTFHAKSGQIVTGTCTYDADTSDATANASEILNTKTAYVNGAKVTGTMPNKGKVTGTITTATQEFSIPAGYHDGSGKVSIDIDEQNKLIAANIRQGVTILGVEGSMSGTEGENTQSNKDVIPSTTQQVITPDADYTCLAQVTVKPIPYTESDNAAGGKTITIA